MEWILRLAEIILTVGAVKREPSDRGGAVHAIRMFAGLIVGLGNAIGATRRGSLPELDLQHAKAGLGSDLVQRFRQILGRGVSIEQQNGLMMLPQDGHHGIVAVQDHVMIEILIDPVADGLFDVPEIGQHSAII